MNRLTFSSLKPSTFINKPNRTMLPLVSCSGWCTELSFKFLPRALDVPAHTCWKQQKNSNWQTDVAAMSNFTLTFTWSLCKEHDEDLFCYLAYTVKILNSQEFSNDFILCRWGLCTISLLMPIFVNVILIGPYTHFHPMKDAVIPWEDNYVRSQLWTCLPSWV